MESVSDAVVSEVPIDSGETIGDWEDGWKFDILELFQGVAVGWEKIPKFRMVNFGEVRSFWEETSQHVCWEHGE